MADSGAGSAGASAVSLADVTTMPSAGPLTATLKSRTVIAPGIVDLVFTMRTPARLRFRAGQFVSIAVGSGSPSGVAPRRSYSIASPSDSGESLRLIIRVIPGGIASDYLMSLSPGDEVRMTGPHGFFVLDSKHAGDVVFGATGTGVSAVMPMLGELLGELSDARGRTPPSGRRVLYWGVRHEADLFARSEIEALCRTAGCGLRLFLTSPAPTWTGETGRITSAILADFPTMVAPTFYLVGNGAMIAEVKRGLIAAGADRKKQIRTEAFFD